VGGVPGQLGGPTPTGPTGVTKPAGSPVSGGTPIPTGTAGRPGVVTGGAGRPPYAVPGGQPGQRPGGVPGRYPTGSGGMPQPGIRQEYLTGPVPGSSRVGLVVAIVVAVIVVAICVGTVIAIAKNKNKANSQGPGDRTLALTVEECERAHGKQFAVIRNQLQERNLRVTRADAISDLARNKVEEIVPCPAAPGSAVTVMVSTGKQAASPTAEVPCVSEANTGGTCPESPKG
jgi:hypothetical protein